MLTVLYWILSILITFVIITAFVMYLVAMNMIVIGEGIKDETVEEIEEA